MPSNCKWTHRLVCHQTSIFFFWQEIEKSDFVHHKHFSCWWVSEERNERLIKGVERISREGWKKRRGWEERRRGWEERGRGAMDVLLKVKMFGLKEGSGREPLDYMNIFSLVFFFFPSHSLSPFPSLLSHLSSPSQHSTFSYGPLIKVIRFFFFFFFFFIPWRDCSQCNLDWKFFL